jgi:class 3 adenylate cyclase
MCGVAGRSAIVKCPHPCERAPSASPACEILNPMGEPIEIKSDSFRVDFKMKVLGERPDGVVEMAFVPDPDRYEWKDDEEHGRVLYDLKTRTRIPESVLGEMAEQMAGTPIYGPPAGIPDFGDLLGGRREVVESALGEGGHPEGLASPSADLLAEKAGQKQEVAVLSVDVVGSTRLQAAEPESYGQILLREIAAVTSVFGGAVINFTGDGAIVGFLGPGFNVANDMAFDAATAVVADVYKVMNPALEAAGLFGIDVRVGLDMNEAEVTAVGSEDSRRQNDVLGIAVSMAAKVQSRGAPGEIWVGQTLYETLHISRQQLLEPASPGEGWDFVNRAGQPYALYRLRVVSPSTPAES